MTNNSDEKADGTPSERSQKPSAPENPFSHFVQPSRTVEPARSPIPQYYPFPPANYSQPIQQYPVNPYASLMPVNPRAGDNAGVISIVASILSFFMWMLPVVNFVCSLTGVIFGHKALSQMSWMPNKDRSIPMIGLCCGYIALLPSTLTTALFLIIQYAELIK